VVNASTAHQTACVIAFRFLFEQIQRGAGILRVLDSRTMNGMDVMKLVDLCTLQALDAGAPLWEQNSEGDEFGIVMAGCIRVLYNRREVTNLVKGQATPTPRHRPP
jgi:hypothetical protein